MYISLYVDVNTFIGGRQPQNKLMRLKTFKKKASCNMRSIDGCIALSQTRQMGTQYNTWYIPHIAQKGSSPHDMSCPSKGITLCQSLIGN